MEQKGTFSSLQHLLELSYSDDPEKQQKAAIDLAVLCEGNVFPVVSFGPLAHALCRLIPSQNRTVASYSAKAIKLLILDDALRPQSIVAGVPAIVCGAIKQWEDEVLCLRELLGALQTLCWDKQTVKGVLQADIITHLIEYTQASDQEVSILAIATIANILAFSDTLLLTDVVVTETLSAAMPQLLDSLRISQQRPQRFYAAACIANASAHPRFCGIIKENGGLELCRDIERQSLANLHILGSKLGHCAQTSIYRLSDKKEGDSKIGQIKYNFKWGTKPIMELSFASYAKYSNSLWLCFSIWLVIVLFTFLPIVWGK